MFQNNQGSLLKHLPNSDYNHEFSPMVSDHLFLCFYKMLTRTESWTSKLYDYISRYLIYVNQNQTTNWTNQFSPDQAWCEIVSVNHRGAHRHRFRKRCRRNK